VPSPPYKISSKSTNLFKICTYLGSLNVRHFGKVEATVLNGMESMSSSMSSSHTRVHPNPPIGSKVIKGFLCTHLKSLNVRHFGMAEGMRLKVWRRSHLQGHHLSTKFHENPPVGSKIISGGPTDRQTQTQTGW
jgi:hypothetical protein